MLAGLPVIALSLLHAVAASSLPLRRETLQEAAVNAKKLVHSVSTGTMASVFPDDGQNAGRPFAMMEYHAPCHPHPDASLTFVLMPISLSTRNILQNENHYATYTVQMPAEGVRSPMSQGRVAFIGNITILPLDSGNELKPCYTAYHPDAKWWTPDVKNGPHFSEWARFDIQDIYYVGGFGDTHYIGHIPVDMYADAEVNEDGMKWQEGSRLTAPPGFVVQA